MDPLGAIGEWRQDVESLPLEAFGRKTAEDVMEWEWGATRETPDELDDLRRRLDEIPLRPGYHGWQRP
jgi:hypothetical protein